MKPSLIFPAHTFICSPLSYFSSSSEECTHSNLFPYWPLRLNSVKPRFSLHTLLKVLQSHANPMAISQFSSSLQCLTSWHPPLLYNSKYYILQVLLADNYSCLSFLLLFLSGSVFYVLFSVLSVPHPASFTVQTGIPQSSFLALTSPELSASPTAQSVSRFQLF